MKQNNLYLKYNPGAEIIAIPFIVSRIIKGKNIKELLYETINALREKAANVKLNELEKFEAQIEYNNSENFFATHFKALENSNEHTFEDKIKYCLKKYAKESKSLLSAANTVVLEENFLKGAIHKELNIDYTKEGQRKVYEYLKNKNKRYFEFRNKEALENISFDKYDNSALIDFEENYDLEKIILTIRDKKQITYYKFKNNEKFAMLHLLFNKGILMNESSCFGGTLYLVDTKN